MSQSSDGPHGPDDQDGPGGTPPRRSGPPPMPSTPPTVGTPRALPPTPPEPTQAGMPAMPPPPPQYPAPPQYRQPPPYVGPAVPVPDTRRRRMALVVGGVAVVVVAALVAVLAIVFLDDDGKGSDQAGGVASSSTPPSAKGSGSPGNTPTTPGSPSATGTGTSPALAASPTLQRAKERGHLVIGAKDDQPGLGFVDPATGERMGFDIEMARMIAEKLGFDPARTEYKTVPSAAREPAVRSGEVDFYIGTYAITEQRKQTVAFAGPYFVTGQGALVRSDETAITGVNTTLNGRVPCTVLGSTPEQYLRLNFPQALTIGRSSYADCMQELRNDTVDAVVTDDAILKGYATTLRGQVKVVGAPTTTEKYGVGMAHDDTALRDAVNDALQQAITDGTWQRIYDRTLGTADAPPPTVPTVERY